MEVSGDELGSFAVRGAGHIRSGVLPVAVLLVRTVAGDGKGNHRAAVLGVARHHISSQIAHQQAFGKAAVDIVLDSGCAQIVIELLLTILLVVAGLETTGNQNAGTLGKLGTQGVADELLRGTDRNKRCILVLTTVDSNAEADICVVADVELLCICSQMTDNSEIVDVSHDNCLLSKDEI